MKRISVLITVALLLALGAGMAVAQSGYDLFQKALIKERAEGNIEEAIQFYQRIVREFADNRALAAKALVQIGQCYEKLGKAEARKAYRRVIREYADQQEQLKIARVRLAALRQPARAADASTMVVRRVWAGPNVDILGAPSPDGRSLSYVDWETGDQAVRDLATGEKRRLTNKGTWLESSEFALFSTMSPDGQQVAYAWFNKDLFYDLRIVGLDGSRARVLYSNKELSYLQPEDWSPDGKHILALFSRTPLTCEP